MAGEINVNLPLFTALGSDTTKDDFGRAPLVLLPVFTASGQQYEHWTVAVTVPMQTVAASFNMGETFEASLVVPRITVAGYGGATGRLTVPKQTLSGTVSVPIVARAALTVPLQVLAGSGMVGAGFRAGLDVPMQTLSTRTGWKVALAVPLVRGAGQVSTDERWTAALSVPLVRGTGTLVLYSRPFRVALDVPLIQPGPYARATLAVPFQRVYGTFVLPTTFEAWVLNTRLDAGGITRWTNMPFIGFTRVGEDTFAVGNDGNLYLLGGDLDVAAPIAWEFETGLSDLGSPALKHIPYLYLDGIINGEIEIVLLDDRGREFAYEYDTKDRGNVHMPHRRKLGNGIRTRSVGFRLRSTSGAYIELDSLEPEATNTQRSM